MRFVILKNLQLHDSKLIENAPINYNKNRIKYPERVKTCFKTLLKHTNLSLEARQAAKQEGVS
jgi:hypothetical protein